MAQSPARVFLFPPNSNAKFGSIQPGPGPGIESMVLDCIVYCDFFAAPARASQLQLLPSAVMKQYASSLTVDAIVVVAI
jgi:hypothetical protein